jgi:hypothetical protein
MEELMEATKTDKNLLADAIGLMQTDKDYLGLNLKGDAGSMSAMTDAAKESLQNSGELSKLANKMGGAMAIARGLGLDEKLSTSMMDAIAAGKEPDMAMFAAGKFDAGKMKGGEADLGVGFSRSMALSALIGAAGKEGMVQLGSLNEGGQMQKALEAQLVELDKAASGGATSIRYKNAAGEEVSSSVADERKQIKAAIKKLENQDLADRGATVVNEIVVHGNIVVHGETKPAVKD